MEKENTFLTGVKLGLIVYVLILLSGCKKTYTCVTNSDNGIQVVSVSQEFKGSKEEKEAFEEQNTFSYTGVDVTTVCN